MFAGGGGGDSIRLPRGSESYSPESALSKRRWSYDRATFAVRLLRFNELCEPVRRASQGAAVARGAARRQLATRLAATALRRLKNAGVAAAVVGSLARGAFKPGSDVDFLIEARGGLNESRITDLVASAMQGFPFDVVFAERVDPSLLRLLRAEAQRGTSVIRAA